MSAPPPPTTSGIGIGIGSSLNLPPNLGAWMEHDLLGYLTFRYKQLLLRMRHEQDEKVEEPEDDGRLQLPLQLQLMIRARLLRSQSRWVSVAKPIKELIKGLWELDQDQDRPHQGQKLSLIHI